MKVYKVVTNGHSCIIGQNLGLDYAIGFITYPEIENSPLFAFNNLEDALEFKNYNVSSLYGDEIFLCEGEEWEGGLVFIPNANFTGAQSLIQWWSEREYLAEGRKWYLPEGTALCKWIKPLERIDDESV